MYKNDTYVTFLGRTKIAINQEFVYFMSHKIAMVKTHFLYFVFPVFCICHTTDNTDVVQKLFKDICKMWLIINHQF